jgi:hypothetical protein
MIDPIAPQAATQTATVKGDSPITSSHRCQDQPCGNGFGADSISLLGASYGFSSIPPF